DILERRGDRPDAPRDEPDCGQGAIERLTSDCWLVAPVPYVQAVAKEIDVRRVFYGLQLRRSLARMIHDDLEPGPRQRRAQPAGLVERQHLAFVEHRDAVTPLGLVEVGRRHEDRDPLLD